MNFSFAKDRVVVSVDTDRRGLGLGLSLYRGDAFYTLSIELPAVLISISYARA
jgi:hypothetical protein